MHIVAQDTPTAETAEITFVEVPMSAIRAEGNYRKTMDSVALAELAEGIKSEGLLHPVRLRPIAGNGPQQYDLVLGFRRHAAHELAGLPTIMASIRIMTDQEVELARLMENVARENPHPADEARAVGLLTKQRLSLAEIALKLCKSEKWVAQRRALSRLLPFWLKQLRKNQVALLAAAEIARWPRVVQERLAAMRANQNQASVVALSTVQNWLGGEQHKLSAAPWDLSDATLLPAAGSCSKCPKRSSCAALLFDDAKAGDTCLDKKCWADKLTASIEAKVAELSTDELPGLRISESYYPQAVGALSSGRYEISKDKKVGRLAVIVDGPNAGQVRRVKVTVSSLTMSRGGVEQSRGELMLSNRKKKLLNAAKKQIVAGRITAQITGPVEDARHIVGDMLAVMIEREIVKHRSQIDPLLVAALVQDWKWEAPAENLNNAAFATWVRAQITTSAPLNEQRVHLLLYVTVRRELSAEFSDHQETLARELKRPDLLATVAEEALALVHQSVDPTTYRPYKKLKLAA